MNIQGIIKDLTRRRKTSPEIPYPDELRTVLVDANGNRIFGRSPQPDDFFARPALPFFFRGTIPSYNSRDYPHNKREEARTAYETEELRNRELLEKAVFYLSQTDDGCRLLQLAKNMKFSFVFDRRTTEARNASGLLDFTNKLIPLHPKTTPEDLMLTVKHELQHMENINDGIAADTQQTLSSFQITSRALECAARVSEAIAAFESAYADPVTTPHAFRPPGVTQAFAARLPKMAAAANSPDACKAASSKDWKRFAQIVFPAFYLETGTLAFYDRDMLGIYDARMPKDMNDRDTEDQLRKIYGQDQAGFQTACYYYRDNFHTMLDSFMIRSDWSHSRIAGLMTVGRQKFLEPSGAGYNLESTDNLALINTPETQPVLQAFRHKIIKLKERGHNIADIDLQELETPPLEPTPHNSPPPSLIVSMRNLAVLRKTDARLNAPPSTLASPVSTPVAKFPFQVFIMPSHTAREAWRHILGGEIKLVAFAKNLANTTMAQRWPNEKMRSASIIYAHTYGRHTGLGSDITASRELVKMGLLAPIGAFPTEYIRDLAARIQEASASSVESEHYKSFDDSEKRLLQHWEAMATHGIDPLNGVHQPPDQLHPSDEESGVQVFGRYLANHFKIAATRQDVATMTTGDMVDWGSKQDQQPIAPRPAGEITALTFSK